MKKERDFIVGFRGTGNFTTISATSLKAAKKKFADLHGVKVSSYITSRSKAHSPKDNLRNTVFN